MSSLNVRETKVRQCFVINDPNNEFLAGHYAVSVNNLSNLRSVREPLICALY